MDSGLLTPWFITVCSSRHPSQGGETSENRCSCKSCEYKPTMRYCLRGVIADIWRSGAALHMLCVEIYRRVCIQSADIIKHVHDLHLCIDNSSLIFTSGPADPSCIAILHLNRLCVCGKYTLCLPVNSDMWRTPQTEMALER